MKRRTVIASLAASSLAVHASRAADGFIDTPDGQKLAFRDTGSGTPVVFLHGWSLSSDIWQSQVDFLVARGHRVIVYDRREHGRSTKPADGYDFNTLADDLAAVLAHTDVADATLVGHSMSGGEIARYFARHGGKRIVRAMFVAPTTPYAVKTEDNPEGTDRKVFDQLVATLAANPKGYLAAGAPGLLGKAPAPETVKWALDMAYQADPKALEQCLRAFTETDFRSDLRAVQVPTLIVYGSGDLPSMASNARRTGALIAGSRVEVYEGAPHGLFITDRERFNNDLLRFIRS